jgi:hypothetical protein
MILSDIVGDAGVVLILGSYLAAQTDRLDPRSDAYLVVNGIGSALVLYSLLHSFNQSAFVIQCSWIAISVVGLVRNALSRRRGVRPKGTRP